MISMVIDEEGKLKGLDVNLQATQIYRENVYNGYIMGPAILIETELLN
jgi:hypothetical protein